MKSETGFRQRLVIPFLKKLDHTVFFAIQQVSIRGVPDFLLCCRGTFVGLELKTDVGELSALQEFNLREIEEKGFGVSIVATPATWPSVKAELRKLNEGVEDD